MLSRRVAADLTSWIGYNRNINIYKRHLFPPAIINRV